MESRITEGYGKSSIAPLFQSGAIMRKPFKFLTKFFVLSTECSFSIIHDECSFPIPFPEEEGTKRICKKK